MPLLSASSLSNDNWRDELGLDIALGELLLIDNGKIALAHPRAKDLHPNRLSSSLIGLLPLIFEKLIWELALRMKIGAGFILGLFLVSAASGAELHDIRFRHLSTEEGLSHPVVGGFNLLAHKKVGRDAVKR
jgi:hypothetical protein